MSNIVISLFKKFAGIPQSAKHGAARIGKENAALSSAIADYENALTSFEVSVSEACHNKIRNALIENAELSADVRGVSLPGEEAEYNRVEGILANTLKYNMLDEVAVIGFVKKVLSLSNFRKKGSAPFGIDPVRLLNEFIGNADYKKIVIDKEQLHQLEFARLMSVFHAVEGDKKDAFDREISDSFNSLAVLCRDNVKYVEIAWIRYFCFSASLGCAVPDVLLDYITKDNYKILFHRVRQRYDKQTGDGKDDIKEYTVAVCKKILNDIRPDDIPAMLMLGRIAEDYGMVDSARFYFTKAANEYDSFNGAMSLISSYENEIRSLIRQKNSVTAKGNTESYDLKIKSANAELSALYESWESRLMKKYRSEEGADVKNQLASLLTKYARCEKNRMHFDKAFDILSRAFDLLPESPESFRMYTELALLHQTPGNRYKSNRYYDPEKAVEMFLKALELLKSETTEKGMKKVEKSILVPLANTYYMTKQYDEAIKVCQSVLAIDSHENNALKLIHTIRSEGFAA